MVQITIEDGWRERLARVAGRRPDAWLLVALVAAAVAVALVFWARAAPDRIAPPARSGEAIPSRGPDAAAPAPKLVVHVAGAVKSPGVYELPEGARVVDAIDKAGGAGARADLDSLNLAGIVSDGSQIYVARRQGAASAPAADASGATPAPSLVNVNTADQAALETLPGVGPVKAAAILAYRQESGTFASVDQLLEVTGIGTVTLESIRPFVEV